ncbi:MAG: 2-amino-4-hydroxy-6-hydroxymethyldihydropteridine diphosphokinase [Bacteroidia bacterium]|jgi:2-amino-4-hydroxy-6-hydroxymethyldihydropteridine diphosphokinase|nr:2-amino-4-hydroxy-6-hydroxymethyldihydropteridine diphosphokinase [Bacteroidia bacterium]
MQVNEVTAYLSLGSNLGNRLEMLHDALKLLHAHGQVSVTKVSPVYQTAAWGKSAQPDFYNCAARISTSLAPEALLDVLLATERALGRERLERWGPRLIDLDLLFWDNVQLTTNRLVVPHPELHRRRFVLLPLADIAPQLIHPGEKQTIAQLAANCSDPLAVTLLPETVFPNT